MCGGIIQTIGPIAVTDAIATPIKTITWKFHRVPFANHKSPQTVDFGCRDLKGLVADRSGERSELVVYNENSSFAHELEIAGFAPSDNRYTRSRIITTGHLSIVNGAKLTLRDNVRMEFPSWCNADDCAFFVGNPRTSYVDTSGHLRTLVPNGAPVLNFPVLAPWDQDSVWWYHWNGVVVEGNAQKSSVEIDGLNIESVIGNTRAVSGASFNVYPMHFKKSAEVKGFNRVRLTLSDRGSRDWDVSPELTSHFMKFDECPAISGPSNWNQVFFGARYYVLEVSNQWFNSNNYAASVKNILLPTACAGPVITLTPLTVPEYGGNTGDQNNSRYGTAFEHDPDSTLNWD